MRNPGGYATILSPVRSKVSLNGGMLCEEIGEGTFEIDTFSCCHCNSVVHVKARERADEYFCRNCMARICSPCADHPCMPLLKKFELIERQEAKQRALRSYGV